MKKNKTKKRAATTAEIFKGKAGWHFRLVARNGQTVAPSESYTRRHDAVRGARRVSPRAAVRYR